MTRGEPYEPAGGQNALCKNVSYLVESLARTKRFVQDISITSEK